MPLDPEKLYVEHMAMYRHYSTLRFLMIPVFVTLTFGLMLEFGNLEHIQVKTPQNIKVAAYWLLPWIGIAISLGFVFIECVLNGYLEHHRGQAAVHDAQGMARFGFFGTNFVSNAFNGLYLIGALYWLALFILGQSQ